MYEEMNERIEHLRNRIEIAAHRAGRCVEDIQLCAVCKTQPAELVAASAVMNVDVFGESRVQELKHKTACGAYARKPVHFIGHLQTNKIKQTVGAVDLIQSVDSSRVLTEIDHCAEQLGVRQKILLQVNLGHEPSKTGYFENELLSALEQAQKMRCLQVCGLMAIPPVRATEAESRRDFERLRLLFEKLAPECGNDNCMKILSMGMSGDFEAAVTEGSTMVRLGTAIYQSRLS